MNRVVAALLACASFASVARAQEATTSGPWCFRSRPLPRCGTIVLYEASYLWHAAGSQLDEISNPAGGGGYPIKRRVFGSHIAGSLGVLRNVSATTGLGAVFDAAAGTDSYDRFALLGRYRRWLGGTSSVDLSLGPAVVSANEPVVQQTYTYFEGRHRIGLTADVTLRLSDWLAGSVQFDAVPTHKPSAAGAVYAGVRFGSWQAVAATGIVALWVGAAIHAPSGTDY
jgi:hypothetical protein